MKESIKKMLPPFVLDWYHFGLAFLGAVIYRFPSRRLKVIGVTGTNGKTTVVNLATRVLEEGGFKVASLSSIKFKIGGKEKENFLKMTMPGRFKIQKFLREALNENCQYVVLEVSSEGIKQHRHRFIDFSAAVFTNLSPEHIEAHKGFENYKKAKGKLFKSTKGVHIINVDDKNAEYFLQFAAQRKITYGLEAGEINDKQLNLQLNLPGVFNICNALAAIGVGFSQGMAIEVCKKVVESAQGIPGRMEEVISRPRVFVDYAFTPNALEKVYQTLKPVNGKMIGVLGACGGGRDKWKRKVLGQLAAKYCEEVIITNEDPYEEPPEKIMEDVASGITYYQIIKDRREAIRKALEMAKFEDVVVITGKGCEPWIIEKERKIPWDDRRVVREEFAKIEKSKENEKI